MIARLRPRTALLAAFALWALALLVLALAGLGGRTATLPDDPALAPPPPAVRLDAVGARLGPASDYLLVGQRPLLSPDRRAAEVTDAGDAGDAPLDAVLSSVLITGELKLAILQANADGASQRVRVGELVPGTRWRLVEVQPRLAVFEGPQGRRSLALRVFDGRGGIAPGPAVTTAPAPAAPAAGSPPPAAAGKDVPPGVSPALATAAAATPAPTAAEAGAEAQATQEQQVEAIRRRIEARRAQMRAENAGRENQQVQ